LGGLAAAVSDLGGSEDFLGQKAPSICALLAAIQYKNTGKSKHFLLDLGGFHKDRKYLKYRKNHP
jgi:hypothetical protein